MEGGDTEEDEVLLNPAHILVGKNGKNKEMAERFREWMVSREGGQEVIRTFAVNGVVLYSMVPGME
jgi:ABC-type tungstate transport system permease subunit